MNFFKSGIQFNKLANSFGDMYIRINELQPLFEKSEADLVKLKNNYKLEILSLAYFANKEIISRMDKYGWDLEAVFRVNKISSNKITIMYAWNQTITKLHMLIGLFELQNEYDEIKNNGPLCSIIENYIENEKKIDRLFGN
tara:strand:+ start:1509 stop:1931 length:423 start_codon:yes stop_codon:yes gene_type:complete